MTILFLDIRGFTERTNQALPYDVVYLLSPDSGAKPGQRIK